MATDQQNKEEEVDLGSLFIIIGNGVRSFFNFIWALLKGLFDFFIQALVFVRVNIIKFVIAAAIGAGVGAYMEMNEESLYGADLLVQPNFNSSRQLYNNLSYYNNLISEKDSALLASTFNISESEAATLRKFEIQPIKSDDDKIEMYFEMVKSLDTVVTENYTFAQFKKSFTDFDYKVHEVHVEGTNSRVFSKLGDAIVSTVLENEYYDYVKKLKKESLFLRDSLLKKNLTQIDTVRRVYMESMLEEAKKDSDGTNIDLGGQQQSSKEIQLFQTNRNIYGALDRVSDQISEKSEVINILSDFQRVGYKIGGLRNNSIIIFSAIAILLTMAIILLLKLNKYLESHIKK